jgi:hypothetical protein
MALTYGYEIRAKARSAIADEKARMSNPSLSVIMSVYNDARYLEEAVDSVLAQSFGDFEFLIVNDGSTDASPAILDGYAAKDSRIRLFHRVNHGLIDSLNFMIEEARTPYLARMDSDDVCRPERFERQMAFLNEHPDLIALGTNTDELDEQSRLMPCHDWHPLDHDSIAKALEQRTPICHPSVIMQRGAVRRVGGYRRAFKYCEDYDLWLRMVSMGQLANLRDRLLLYRRSPDQVSQRHVVDQTIGAELARMAYAERLAGRPDPFGNAESLPRLGELDAFFGRAGFDQRMQDYLSVALVHSRLAMSGIGFPIVLEQAGRTGATWPMWKTVMRLMKMGLPRNAALLAMRLVSNPFPKGTPRAA